jgi:hypothetical protein
LREGAELLDHAAQPNPERSGAFGGFIGPRTLVSLVENALPWLLGSPALAERVGAPRVGSLCQLAAGPLGWWSVLRAADRLGPSDDPTPAQRTDYFALCLAAHFASAASFVPTDVDSKIRRALWQGAVGTPELARMRALALGLAEWDVAEVSARMVNVEPVGVVSGHDGERLSVLCGGLVASLRARESAGAAELEAAIEDELTREARAFAALERAPGRELDLLRLAAVLTHNAGDLMQGLAHAGKSSLLAERFGDLARAGPTRYGGAFVRAAALYRALLASEGHRNYPLRGPRALRRAPELLLPIAPLLDDWGDRIATTRALATRDRAQVVEALAHGCIKLPGQQGYYRALAGFSRASPRGLEDPDLAEHHAASTRRLLRSSDLRRKVAVPRASFESQLAKRARAVLGATSPPSRATP